MNAEQINKAIDSHGKWKARLVDAINAGKSDLNIATVRSDCQCEFGNWLDGADISPSHKESADFQTVKRLHSQFHQVAAEVLNLALSGRKVDADAALSPTGRFSLASSTLVQSLISWKKAVSGS